MIKSCLIDELETYCGEKLYVIIDDVSGEDIKEFTESDGHDIETARMWAVSKGYDKIRFG